MIRLTNTEPDADGVMRLVCGPAMVCAVCGSSEIAAVAPGSDDETLDGELGPLGRRFVVARGTAARAWCAACWPWRPV